VDRARHWTDLIEALTFMSKEFDKEAVHFSSVESLARSLTDEDRQRQVDGLRSVRALLLESYPDSDALSFAIERLDRAISALQGRHTKH
jgi:hypothetical protein